MDGSFEEGQPAEEPDDELLLTGLLANSCKFSKLRPFSTVENTIWVMLDRHSTSHPQLRGQVAHHARNSHIIVHSNVAILLEEFLADRRGHHGTEPERALYSDMDVPRLVRRLICCRPLMFLGKQVTTHNMCLHLSDGPDGCLQDFWMLIDGTEGEGGFELVGTPDQSEPILLQNYLSYDEIALSALLVVSTPTHFINDGEKLNFGRTDGHLRSGILVATVGARFERPDVMESTTMLVDRVTCTAENGYGGDGSDSKRRAWLNMWARCFDLPGGSLPTASEAELQAPGRGGVFDDQTRATESLFVRTGQSSFLNAVAYTARMRILAEWYVCD